MRLCSLFVPQIDEDFEGGVAFPSQLGVHIQSLRAGERYYIYNNLYLIIVYSSFPSSSFPLPEKNPKIFFITSCAFGSK